MKRSRLLTFALAASLLSCVGCDYMPNLAPPHDAKQADSQASTASDAAGPAEAPAG